MNSWNLLRNGNTNEALHEVTNRYRENGTPSIAIELGVMLMYLGRYDDAIRHLYDYKKSSHWSMDKIHAMLGTAEWCDGRQAAAVETWKAGIDTDYSDFARGVTIPLLLFFTSKLAPDLFSPIESQYLSNQKRPSLKLDSYPGILLKLVLGDISETKDICEKERPGDRHNCESLSMFWKSVRDYSDDKLHFLRSMKTFGNITWDDFDTDSKRFLSRLWLPEFYLARYEACNDR